MDYASSPGAAPDGSAGHKRHLNRPPTRIITRWTRKSPVTSLRFADLMMLSEDQLESLLLSVFKVMSDDDISLDWDEVGRLTNEHSTGGAILQMIVKLRLKRLAAGKRVPPPLQLKRVVRRAGSVKAVSFGKPRPLVKTESDAETLQNAKKSFGSKRSRIKLERRCKTFLPKPSAAYPLDWNRDVSTETGAKYGTPYRVRHTSIDSTETASDPLLKRLLVTLKLRRAILAHYVTSDRFNSTQPRAEVRCPTALPLELVQENASANSGESINLPQGGIEPSNSNSFSLEDLSNHDASMHVDEPTIFSPRSGARPPYPTMLSSEHFFNQDASPNVGEAPHLPVRDDGSRFRGMFEVESGYHCLPEHYSMPDALPHVHGSGGPHYPLPPRPTAVTTLYLLQEINVATMSSVACIIVLAPRLTAVTTLHLLRDINVAIMSPVASIIVLAPRPTAVTIPHFFREINVATMSPVACIIVLAPRLTAVLKLHLREINVATAG